MKPRAMTVAFADMAVSRSTDSDVRMAAENLARYQREAGEEFEGRAFDAAWVNLANAWLTTLILDNNRTVKQQIGPALQPVAREHTIWLFHQTSDLDKLRKKFK